MIMFPPDSDGEWPDKEKYVTMCETQKDSSLKIRIETWNTNTNPWEETYEDTNLKEEFLYEI